VDILGLLVLKFFKKAESIGRVT